MSVGKSQSNNKSNNFRKLVGSPFSKIKVKNIIESGSFIKDITEINNRIKAPMGYKILKGVGVQLQKSPIFVA